MEFIHAFSVFSICSVAAHGADLLVDVPIAVDADRKRTFTICGLSALCVAVLAGAWFLTREPEREFIPASTEASGGTDTWEENPGTDTSLPDAAAKESTQIQGTASNNTQTVVSEDETGSTTSRLVSCFMWSSFS